MVDTLNSITAVTAGETDAGRRLDRVLVAHVPDMSRSQLQEHIKTGRLSIGGRTVTDAGYKVKLGDHIHLETPPPRPAEPQGERIALNVVYEDGDLIVIDKQAGLVVHPAPGARDGTLVNALIAHCGASLSGIGGVLRPGIVHRLDKDTTGLMVVAKNDKTHRHLAEQFADHGRTGVLERRYLALTWGKPKMRGGIVRNLIARHPVDRKKMAVVKSRGREAITHYKVVETLRCGSPKSAGVVEASLISCTLETGRTHQVRVHMAGLGCPIIGDATYGAGYQSKIRVLPDEAQSEIIKLQRQALHAETLAFEHPTSKKLVRFSSAAPDDMTSAIEILRSCQVKS